MRKLILALALFLIPSLATAQCNGVFPASNVCGTTSSGPNIPGPLPLSSFALSPGGISGQLQYNNGSGGLGGMPSMSGACALNTTTGVITCASATNIFANIAALRANTAATPNVYVQGYTSVSDGGEGPLNYVASDTTTADNGCTIFVDASNHRYYRSLGLDGISVKWCGAKGDAITDDTVAIQRGINFARGYAVGTVNAGGLCVTFPTGAYIVSSLDATKWSGGCIQGSPPGSGAVYVYAATQISPGPVLDISSSPGFFSQNILFTATTTGGVAPPVIPNTGLLITPAVGLSDTDLIRFNFVAFVGFYSTAACYIYSITDIRFDSSNCVNQNLSAGYGIMMSNVNVFGITSPFTTTGTGTGVCADITWYGGAGGFGGYAANGAGTLIQGCQGIRFRDGVVAAGNNSHYIQLNGSNQSLVFDSLQLNEAVATPLDFIFLSATTITGMTVLNAQVGGQYSGNMMTGSGSTCTGCVILGVAPASITGSTAGLFSHLP